MRKQDELYSFYKDKEYSYKTCKQERLFLSYPKTFNDKFDGKPLIDEDKFIFTYCSKKFGLNNAERFFKNNYHNFSYRKKLEFICNYKFEKSECDQNKCDSIFLDYGIHRLIEEINQIYNAYVNELERICNNFGIACFSSGIPHDNMVLWAHYAENYKGFCIKYDLLDYVISDIGTEREDLYQTFLRSHVHEIKYVNKYLFLDTKKLLNIPVSELSNSQYIKEYIFKILTHKHKQWSYEKELRLIINKSELPKNEILEENKNGFEISFPFFNSVYGFDMTNNSDTCEKIKSIATHTNSFCFNLGINNKQSCLYDTKTFLIENYKLQRGL